ncbi:MAG TPA: low temperature requirement protein A, partial [Thermomicrobiales bacterium]|nr:low temperature requirement protein A [Thermomicrobiales bacterium]
RAPVVGQPGVIASSWSTTSRGRPRPDPRSVPSELLALPCPSGPACAVSILQRMAPPSPGKVEFKRWLFAPPRPHGALDKDRTVSNLELFYDLVYVAVIGAAASALKSDISMGGVTIFAIVFGMVWIAWLNGSLYVELHGREDGRTRLLVFLQMGILALLAVFTAHAANGTGTQFALAYAAFLAVMTWQWWRVRELDRTDRPEFLPITAFYVGGMVASTAIVLASAFLPTDVRLIAWTVFVIGWLAGITFAARATRTGQTEGILPTESIVERFGGFTIIVLGEVILGVVAGLAAVEPDALTIVTGLLALVIGFGLWWIYFDFVGRRLPRNTRGTIGAWMLSHLPITASITAAGAAIVSLVEHAHDPTTPAPTAWLLAASVALGLLSLILTSQSLEDAVRLERVYRPLKLALAVGALVALAAGWLALAPWLLALLLVAILSALWFFAVAWLIRAGSWTST